MKKVLTTRRGGSSWGASYGLGASVVSKGPFDSRRSMDPLRRSSDDVDQRPPKQDEHLQLIVVSTYLEGVTVE